MPVSITVSYGTVVGQFVSSVVDTNIDPDILPDAIAMGGTITFTPSVPYVKNILDPINPVTIVKTPITAILDAEGYLCTPTIDPATGKYARGVTLVATDDDNLNPIDWTWGVDYRLTSNGKSIAGPARHYIEVPTNTTVDLTVASPVPSSTGTPIVKGAKGDPAITTVEHGTNGAIARPDTVGVVYWIGTAQPVNAEPFDWWYSV